ncbi:MAG TPA: hypothetical protein VFS02_22085, partial [Telluria sp.]|nr:hypothetical protein [Telluria sp.]
WAEKADNYSAQCRTAASGNDNRRAIRAEVEHYRRFRARAAKRFLGETRASRCFLTDTACFPD